MGLSLVSGPSSEPITLEEAREQCRITHCDDNSMLAMLIQSAREWGQGYCGRIFVPQTWDYSLDAFEPCIELPFAPVQSITSITYKDAAGVTRTLAATVYESDLKSVVPRIRCASGQSWPSTADAFGAVTVRFVSGYAKGHPDLARIKAAVRLHVEAHYDRDTQNFETLMAAAKAMLWPLKITSF